MKKLLGLSLKYKFAVFFFTALIVVSGILSFMNTPIDAFPDVTNTQVTIITQWQGRSAEEIEKFVTAPLEISMNGVQKKSSVRSTTLFGLSVVNIMFDDGVDNNFARMQINNALQGIDLPDGVEPYLAPDTTALGQIFWYTVEGDGYDIGRLRAIQDWFVKYQLYSVPGVAEVASVGGFPVEYQVDVDPNKLRSYGLTLGELYGAVARSNSAVGGRVIQKGNSEYLVRSTGWIKSLADVETTVIKSIGGTPVHVGDVATVQYGSAQRRSVLEKNGNEAPSVPESGVAFA